MSVKTSNLSVAFTIGGNPPTMQATFTTPVTQTTAVTIPPFTTFTVDGTSYYNLSPIVVPGGAVIGVTVPLQKGAASQQGANVTLSTLSVDYNSGKTQLQAMLGSSSTPWKAVLPTETGDTIISLISTVHASAQQNILRSLQDAFPATAVSDSAIYAGATMQGVRLNRKLPANLPVAITNKNANQITIPPYTLFAGANTYWFNRDFITIDPGQTVDNYALYQGVVKAMNTNGLGSPYQAWVSPEAGFTVSDSDTYVSVNGEAIPKLTTGLWTANIGKGFLDKTLPTGEFVAEFGDGRYGSSPLVSDSVVITYVVTSGAAANSLNAINKSITTSDIQNLLINALGNPSGGADETSALRYKNIAAYSFGTFGSAVNKSQYLTTILEYPGIADAVTFSEREIFTANPALMNYVQVTYLLKAGVVWDSVATTNFVKYLEANCNYSTRFNIVPPVVNPVSVIASVFCKSWANLDQAKSAATSAVVNIFANAGLNYDVMLTDITTAILSSYAGIDYVDLVEPTKDAVVSTPWIPAPNITVGAANSGILKEGAVAYAIGYKTGGSGFVAPKNIAYAVVPANKSSVTITWAGISSAESYVVYGRGGLSSTWGVIAENLTSPRFVDNGRVSPRPTSTVGTILPSNVVRYNALNTSTDTSGNSQFSITAYYSQRSGSSSSQG